MPSASVRTSRRTVKEVIDLVSSGEEDVKPELTVKTARKPLAPRSKLPLPIVGTSTSSRGKSLKKEFSRKLDIKPIVIQDDEDDIFARLLSAVNTPAKVSKPAAPSILPKESNVKKEVEENKPARTILEQQDVKMEREDIDVKPELAYCSQTPLKHQSVEGIKPRISSTPLFLPVSPALSTPARPEARTVVHSPMQDVKPNVQSPARNRKDEPAVAPLFSDDSPIRPCTSHGSIGPPRSPQYRSSTSDSESDNESVSHHSLSSPCHSHSESDGGSPIRSTPRPFSAFPLPPTSVSKKNRYDRLKALAESRKNPQTPRTARRAIHNHGRSTRSQVPSAGNYSEEEEEEDEDEDEDGDKDGEYDLGKHYDTSLGSLKDFIVDDSDVSGLEDGHIDMLRESEDELDEAEDLLGSPPKKRDPISHKDPMVPKGKKKIDRNVVHVVNSDSEEEGDTVDIDILRYTPPGHSVDLPDFSRLTLYGDEEEKDKTSEDGKPFARRNEKISPVKRDERSWKLERERIARKIFDELDRRVFDKKLGGASIEWNKRLLTTAGKAHCRREKHPDGTRKLSGRIELSEKVLTGEEQILNTVAHEMCHLACFMISEEWKNPHGRVFKSWGRKVMRARPDIEVTTTHNYTIEYKYRWKCSNEKCFVTYRRHSKSIDIEKENCWKCGNNLVPLFETKASNPFQTYLKDNMKYAKTAMPGATHGDVMRALSAQWQSAPGTDHQAHWRAMAAVQA